eukprot:TRINITY_DN64286_c0_g1_i1.p1 TRINITY_DN64286_c0_g1~~TRINITY_DN64286_c0_g1_i1.p1  ORF type:complete len:440 (-),score=54.36 TRINITY_DN64286_c0_g1_i1:68-1387(-)
MKMELLDLLLILISIFPGEGMKPRFIDEMRNITVEVGRDVTFTCTVSDIHGYRIGWVKANTKAIQAIGTHVITHNTRVSVSHDESRRRWNLHIADAQLDDTGAYMCQVNTDPMRFKMGYLDVVITPDIIDIRGPEVVTEGSSAILECEARGEPPPMVFWQRERTGEKITVYNTDGTSSRHVRVEGSALHLKKMRREQAGGYLCIASNGHPPAVSRRIQLDVKFRPLVTATEKHVYGYIGKTAVLMCEVESYPRAEITWVKRNQPYVSMSGGRYIKEDFHLNDYKTKSVLNIYNYTSQDEGLYDCRSKNEMNMNSKTVDGVIYLNTARESLHGNLGGSHSAEETEEGETTTDLYYTIITDYDFSVEPKYKPKLYEYNTEPPAVTKWKGKTAGGHGNRGSRTRTKHQPTSQRFLNSAVKCTFSLMWFLEGLPIIIIQLIYF